MSNNVLEITYFDAATSKDVGCTSVRWGDTLKGGFADSAAASLMPDHVSKMQDSTNILWSLEVISEAEWIIRNPLRILHEPPEWSDPRPKTLPLVTKDGGVVRLTQTVLPKLQVPLRNMLLDLFDGANEATREHYTRVICKLTDIPPHQLSEWMYRAEGNPCPFEFDHNQERMIRRLVRRELRGRAETWFYETHISKKNKKKTSRARFYIGWAAVGLIAYAIVNHLFS